LLRVRPSSIRLTLCVMSRGARVVPCRPFLMCSLILLCLAVPLHAATGRVECNSLLSKFGSRAVPYCIMLPPAFDADKTRHFPVLYLLHGLGDNEQFFIHSGEWNLVEDMREKGELKDFLIATPEGGASFYINAKRYRASPGRANRAISGISMGGYGALHLAFRHPQLFSAVSAHSAALIEKLPVFLGGAAPQSGQPNRARIFGGVFGSPPDPAYWNGESPITLARTANLAGLKIYFDCGDQDDYGFDAGVAALDKVLTARHMAHEFHLYSGRHDASYFAAHLPASLEFHSRLFAR